MRSRASDSLLLLPLLPIFLVGLPPMLLLTFLGFAGLVILGVLLICVGLAYGLEASSDFNQEIIVHGYARRSERTVQASNLHSEIRFATVMNATGAGLIVVGLFGFFCFG
jgi:protein-S-isoprenylcysteine O-methyltransferase Ste14